MEQTIIIKKEEIIEEMNKEFNDAITLCGTDIKLLPKRSVERSVVADAFVSSTLIRMEAIAGYDGHHIKKSLKRNLLSR